MGQPIQEGFGIQVSYSGNPNSAHDLSMSVKISKVWELIPGFQTLKMNYVNTVDFVTFVP